MDAREIWKQIKTNPFSILGIHQYGNKFIIRVLNNGAYEAVAIDKKTNKQYPLSVDENGFFFTKVDTCISYQILFKRGNDEWITEDPYVFSPCLSEYDLYLFCEGTHRRVWEMMGSHIHTYNGIIGVLFSVWAPNAYSVRVMGDFNCWNSDSYFMRHRGDTGIWELFIPGLKSGHTYKYAIETSENVIIEKSDPYCIYAEKRPSTSSIIYDINGFNWQDNKWLSLRTKNIDSPLSIYECHIDTWIRDENNHSFSYNELAEPMALYLLDHGFTHVELMPITEFPFDGSWGYQVTGYYAPTSRYGTPHDFMYFVDYLHQKGLGVIIDWVPAHFPHDAHGLSRFDGTALYEHEDPMLGWHYDWETYIFNYGRTEVNQFLIGSALYWLEKYHIDGIRIDAVSSMLYLDYSRKTGEWIPNKYGGHENLEAIEFLQSLNTEVARYHPEVMTIAEESTSFLHVTTPTADGGLGFTYKWNMGWMNDTLHYFSIDPLFRPWHHQEITFSLMYAFTENFILPFSHDEVVHGKKTLLDRMPGSEWEKFANLRLMYTYMWCHPGKKLLFAAQEWAPWQEWNEIDSVSWHLNKYSSHTGIRYLIQDLNSVYQKESALFDCDSDPQTFLWVDCDNIETGLLMWIRSDRFGNKVLIVLNLNTIVKENFCIGIPYQGMYQEIFNSNNSHYGGAHILNDTPIWSENISHQNQPHSIFINIGPLAGSIFKISN